MRVKIEDEVKAKLYIKTALIVDSVDALPTFDRVGDMARASNILSAY